jgi:glycosyltransferase involved in cell wall biosynthesis
MRIALVHDFLREYGGAERVLEVLHEMYPNAPVYTAFLDIDGLGPHAERIQKWQVKTSWAQKIPFFSKLYSPLRFLAPLFFESFDFSGFDVVISSTNAYYAKGIITQPETVHICYCHTPPRSLYGYQTRMDWKKNLFTRIFGNFMNYFLRKYDYLAAQRVDFFIANSQTVQERIRKFYRRQSVVVYPPAGLETSVKVKSEKSKVQVKNKNDTYYLYVGKLAAAKNVNLAVEAVIRLGLNLKIVGKGGEEENLKKLANSHIELLGEVDDEKLALLYKNCRAVLYPAIDEDFGIVPVEAMRFGKPVVGIQSGGVAETIIDRKTGFLMKEGTVENMIKAINDLEKSEIDCKDCIAQAQKFNKREFVIKISEIVNDQYRNNNLNR